MPKVNWKAKLEYEYLSNFKIVTTCLEKNDVKKHVDVKKGFEKENFLLLWCFCKFVLISDLK